MAKSSHMQMNLMHILLVPQKKRNQEIQCATKFKVHFLPQSFYQGIKRLLDTISEKFIHHVGKYYRSHHQYNGHQ